MTVSDAAHSVMNSPLNRSVVSSPANVGTDEGRSQWGGARRFFGAWALFNILEKLYLRARGNL
ncbi:hypothetical protein PsJ27TS7_22730 [Paenibacillus dendritiformis]